MGLRCFSPFSPLAAHLLDSFFFFFVFLEFVTIILLFNAFCLLALRHVRS